MEVSKFQPTTFTHIHIINSFRIDDEHGAYDAYNYFLMVIESGTPLTVALCECILSKVSQAKLPETIDLFLSLPERIQRQPKVLSKVIAFCGDTNQVRLGFKLLKKHSEQHNHVDKKLPFAALSMCVNNLGSLKYVPKIFKLLLRPKANTSVFHGLSLSVLRRVHRLRLPHYIQVFYSFLDCGALALNSTVLAMMLEMSQSIAPAKAEELWRDATINRGLQPNSVCFAMYAQCLNTADSQKELQNAPELVYDLLVQVLNKNTKEIPFRFTSAIIQVLVRNDDSRAKAVVKAIQEGQLPVPTDPAGRTALRKANKEVLATVDIPLPVLRT